MFYSKSQIVPIEIRVQVDCCAKARHVCFLLRLLFLCCSRQVVNKITVLSFFK